MDKFGTRKATPDSAALFRETVRNQNMFIRDVFGNHHVDERDKALDFRCTLDEEQPEFHPPIFLNG